MWFNPDAGVDLCWGLFRGTEGCLTLMLRVVLVTCRGESLAPKVLEAWARFFGVVVGSSVFWTPTIGGDAVFA